MHIVRHNLCRRDTPRLSCRQWKTWRDQSQKKGNNIFSGLISEYWSSIILIGPPPYHPSHDKLVNIAIQGIKYQDEDIDEDKDKNEAIDDDKDADKYLS